MDQPPSLDEFNACATELEIISGSGAPLKFVAPDDAGLASGLAYEVRTFERGEVVTRPDNWHDAYNALVWLEFPRSKAVLNSRHVEALAGEVPGKRAQVRDHITQFDECGVVITGMRSEVWQDLCAHRFNDFGVTHPHVVNSVTAEAIDVFASQQIPHH